MGNKNAEKELEKYREKKANILIPSTRIEGLSDWHKAVIDSVVLSSNPEDGDVYLFQKATDDAPAQYIITGQGLQKLAVCAGVAWHPGETRATAQSQDYVAYKAVGCIRKADGTQTCFQAEYDIDMGVEEDKIREAWKQKSTDWTVGRWKKQWFIKMGAEKQADYCDSKIRGEINFKRTHKTKLAATGAKNRVIRSLLGLKKTYTAKELEKPFVMPRIVVSPPMNDPDVKRALIAAHVQALTGIYGGNVAPPMLPANQADAEIIDVPHEPFEDDDEPMGTDVPVPEPQETDIPNQPEKEPEGPPAPEPQETNDSPPPPFEDLQPEDQCAELMRLVRLKGFPEDKIPRPFDEMADATRQKWHWHLTNQPDAK